MAEDFRRSYNELFKGVIEIFSGEYDKRGMSRISEMRKMFENDIYKKTIADEIYRYLGKRNSNANSRIFGIDNILKKEIERVVFNNLFGSPD